MQTQLDISPLSCMGQWQKNLFHQNIAVKDLPYELMKEFLDEIRGDARRRMNWEMCIELQFRTWKIKKSATLNQFVQIMMKRNCKFEYLQKVANNLHDLSFKKYFYGGQYPEYAMRENARIQADQNTSRGYLKDISYETLKELSDLLADDFSWKKMGDGLGFNFCECFYFSDPLEMFQKWLLKSPDGTLDRIYFEVERLGFNNVCKYLDGIPLEKISAIVVRDPHSSHPELRPATIFDLEKIDEVCGEKIDWAGVSHLIFNSYCSKKEDIWLSGNVTLNQLKVALDVCHKKSLIGFEHFEPMNLRGVTYNQMAFLADAINSDSWMTERRFAELISDKIGFCDFRIKHLSIRNFLCLYWQLNRELDLTQFFNKTLELFYPTAPSTGRILYYGFQVIKPKRFYSAK